MSCECDVVDFKVTEELKTQNIFGVFFSSYYLVDETIKRINLLGLESF